MNQTKLTFAGIGTRKHNDVGVVSMVEVATRAFDKGLHLHSGGAEFSDSIYEAIYLEKGSNKDHMSIFLPWGGFNGKYQNLDYGYYSMNNYDQNSLQQAQIIAKYYHPNWDACSNGAKLLHTRNVLQILGPTLDKPVNFVSAFTIGGKDTGGTGQAIRIARDLKIKVFNLFNDNDHNDLIDYLNSLQ